MRLWSLNLLFIKCFQDCFHQIILATYNCWALRRWCSFNMDLLLAAIIACPAFLKIKPWWFNRAIATSVLITRMLWIMDLPTDDIFSPYLNCIWSQVRGANATTGQICYCFHFWFSTKYCSQESLVGIENSAILHSLFTLGDPGWAPHSVSADGWKKCVRKKLSTAFDVVFWVDSKYIKECTKYMYNICFGY